MAALSDAAPWRIVADGLAVQLRVTPKAGRDRLDGIGTLADGRPAIRAAVRAAPEGGKANAALIALLAKRWRLPKSALAVTGGATGRLKTITIRGDGADLVAKLDEWRVAAEAGAKSGKRT